LVESVMAEEVARAEQSGEIPTDTSAKG